MRQLEPVGAIRAHQSLALFRVLQNTKAHLNDEYVLINDDESSNHISNRVIKIKSAIDQATARVANGFHHFNAAVFDWMTRRRDGDVWQFSHIFYRLGVQVLGVPRLTGSRRNKKQKILF